MEIKINITTEEIMKLRNNNDAQNVDIEFLTGLFCDNYCKYPDGHISQKLLNGICNACPMRLISEG